MPTFVDMLNDRTWTQDAACRDAEDPDAWFIGDGGRDKGNMGSTRVLAAVRTCFSCPVRTECLSEALRSESQGIWAGTTEYDRAEVMRLIPEPTPEAIAAAVVVLEAGAMRRLNARRLAWEKTHPLRRCPGCGTMFRAPRLKSRTCSPKCWHVANRRVSAAAEPPVPSSGV